MVEEPACRGIVKGRSAGAVCVIDTSIFCEIIGVPHMNSASTELRSEFARKVEAGEALMLPLVAIIETGNHIGQNGDGTLRRRTALEFAKQVRSAIEGTAPFTITPLHEKDTLLDRLNGAFPNGSSFRITRAGDPGLEIT